MSEPCCCSCQEAIKGVRLRCIECTDFDLCLQCFSCGAEVGTHRKEHDYRLHESNDFPLFDTKQCNWSAAGQSNWSAAGQSNWSAADEVLLLDAVEQYGFGNWQDTAARIQTKDGDQSKDHFEKYYIHGNIGQLTFDKPFINKVTDHTTEDDSGPLSPSITMPLPPLEISIQEKQELGYMPYRDDFEIEYDNQAESSLSSLMILYDDEEIDKDYKLAQVGMYRERLHERVRRKHIAREYNLISQATSLYNKQKQQQGTKKKYSREEREFRDKMRTFAQFHSPIEHDKYFENLTKEKQIKSRIKELMRYRKNGITKLEECSEFDEERSRREKKKIIKKKMSSPPQLKRTSMNSIRAEGLDISSLSDTSSGGEKYEPKAKKRSKQSRHLSSLPGNDLLTDRERKLCNSIGMSPGNYLTIKTCIIKDYLQRRQGHQVKFRYPSGFDKTHRRKIMSFLTNNGWIETDSAYA